MDANQFLDGISQRMQSFQEMQAATASSAEYARTKAQQELGTLNAMCARFAAGESRDYEAVSRGAHIAAYELMSYGEICACLDVRPKEDCEYIMAAARGMLDRVREQEHHFLAGSLSPSHVFYDDLVDSKVLDIEHGQASLVNKEDRLGALAEVAESQLA